MGCNEALVAALLPALRLVHAVDASSSGRIKLLLCVCHGLHLPSHAAGDDALLLPRRSYEALDAGLLPPLWLVHASDASDSGRMHSDVRRRWDAGDPAVVCAMAEVASLAEQGRCGPVSPEALQARRH